MNKLFAIGDIHGCLNKLRDLLDRVSVNPQKDTLIFLGDYVDRGPDSRGVVSLLLALRERFPRMVCLLGNHEDMFLSFLEERRDEDLFLDNGGRATLRDYGIGHPAEAEPSRIPDDHWRFLHTLPIHYETQDFIFVHGGLRPGVPLERQCREDMIWIREDFFHSSTTFGKTVVFGHTPFSEPFLRKDRIGIDTGAVYGGKLTCIELPDRKIHQV